MKRILTTILLPMTVAMFFTGCSSLAGDAHVDMTEIESSAWQEAYTDENGDRRLDMNEEKETMPNYFEQNLTEKFKDLGGKPAFRMEKGHSQKTDDIEAFFIAGLRADKTFVYGYTTRVGSGEEGGENGSGSGEGGAGNGAESGEGGAEDGAESGEGGAESQEEELILVKDKDNNVPLVHCGAFYNYDTGEFQVFHETTFTRSQEETGEDEESFFMQMSETDGQVFVYDNGHGYRNLCESPVCGRLLGDRGQRGDGLAEPGLFGSVHREGKNRSSRAGKDNGAGSGHISQCLEGDGAVQRGRG